MVISAIGEAGGIGKTWLALAWAHQHAEQFPDGQLFVDLHGFSPTVEPMAPVVAVRRFLDALGVDPGRIPSDLDSQAALYRSLVAGRRMLMVLDNAATAEQVVPLLPGSPTCAVLITGRTRLASLIDRHGARHLQLDVMNRVQARGLITARLGADRAAVAAGAVDELVELCGGYPLALSITARNASADPGIHLAEAATELRERGLESLDHDTDPAASLPIVLSWSLRRLTDAQRAVFGLLGIAPGPDIALPAVACLADLPRTQARRALSVLQEASLLERRPGGRYAMHDLIRRYAADTAQCQLSVDVREKALTRVVDFYLHTAHAANPVIEPHRHLRRLEPPAPGYRSHPLPDIPSALAWFDAEHANLLAAQHTAATHQWHRAVWQLAWALDTFHLRRGFRRGRLAVWQAGLAAADHLRDDAIRVLANRFLGVAYTELGKHDESIRHLHESLALAEHQHDHANQGHAHRALSRAWELRENELQALEHATQALAIFRTLDNPVWEAWALNDVGWCAAQLNDYDQAGDHCRAALALFRCHHDPHGEAETCDSLGYIDQHTGNHEQAVHHYLRALALRRGLGHNYQVATTLDGLGRAHVALGQHDQARAVWLNRERSTDHGDAAVRQTENMLCRPENHRRCGACASDR